MEPQNTVIDPDGAYLATPDIIQKCPGGDLKKGGCLRGS
jgi:hypothetical protein